MIAPLPARVAALMQRVRSGETTDSDARLLEGLLTRVWAVRGVLDGDEMSEFWLALAALKQGADALEKALDPVAKELA